MTSTAPTTSRRAPGRDRNHLRPGRPRQMHLRYTLEEYATIASAARDTGLTPTGYVAEAALAAANNTQTPSPAPWRTVLLKLIEAHAQVRWIGTTTPPPVSTPPANHRCGSIGPGSSRTGPSPT